MNRYQIYLDPHKVEVIDQIALELDLSRSHIYRDVLERIALEYKKVLVAKRTFSLKDNPILKLSGIGKSNSPNLSQDVDSIYRKD